MRKEGGRGIIVGFPGQTIEFKLLKWVMQMIDDEREAGAPNQKCSSAVWSGISYGNGDQYI